MSKRIFNVIAGLVVVVAFAVGCGGDSTESGEATRATKTADVQGVQPSSLSKAEFIQRADSTCAEARSQIVGEMREYLGSAPRAGSRGAQFAEVAEKVVIPGMQELIDRFRAFGAPAGDEEEIAAIVETMQQGLDRSKRSKASRAATLTGESPFAEADVLAAAYGLSECANL